jgi:myosin heavy subunit
MKTKDFVRRFEAMLSGPRKFKNMVAKATNILEAGISARRASLPALPKSSELPVLYVFGKTTLFFTTGVLEAMEDIRMVHMTRCAVKIQTGARGKLARMDFRRRFAGFELTRRLQAWCRGTLQLRRYLLLRRSIIRAQTRYRGKAARNRVLAIRADRERNAAELEMRAQQELQEAAEHRDKMNTVAAANADKAWRRKKANKNLAKAEAREVAAKAAVVKAGEDVKTEHHTRAALLDKEERMRQDAAKSMEMALHYSEEKAQADGEKVQKFSSAGQQVLLIDYGLQVQCRP